MFRVGMPSLKRFSPLHVPQGCWLTHWVNPALCGHFCEPASAVSRFYAWTKGESWTMHWTIFIVWGLETWANGSHKCVHLLYYCKNEQGTIIRNTYEFVLNKTMLLAYTLQEITHCIFRQCIHFGMKIKVYKPQSLQWWLGIPRSGNGGDGQVNKILSHVKNVNIELDSTNKPLLIWRDSFNHMCGWWLSWFHTSSHSELRGRQWYGGVRVTWEK